MAYYIGADVGGTNIACGVVDEGCGIIARCKVKTNPRGRDGEPPSYGEILGELKEAIRGACAEAGISPSEAYSIGIGCPGTCNSESGVVEYSNNLGLLNVPLRGDIEKEFGVKVYLENDANAAAFGEFAAGAAKGSRNAVVITLGTGVGSGIIIDGKIYRGANFAGGELGHTVIVMDGLPCTCGRRGCFEAYSSATGLVRMTARAAELNPDSILARMIREDGKVSARTAYKAMKEGDEAGRAVTEQYVKYLSCGIANAINIFQPDILCIGGGVCNEGDTLLVPLRKAVSEQVYSKNSAKNTEIVICSLGNDAGIIGAAMLFKG
ncbi:MAG: ROK family protein [Lachnospiraceae bacterium]|nr:ROK family protein [Ruminococcus sp.]MCM1274551.1 ROK family protein [Lachnospiraceae bacterium]